MRQNFKITTKKKVKKKIYILIKINKNLYDIFIIWYLKNFKNKINIIILVINVIKNIKL